MKKVFFLLQSMNVGGVEKALCGLLSVLPLDNLEIHVGLIQKKGGFLDMLPSVVTVHEMVGIADKWHLLNAAPTSIIKQMVRSNHFFDALIHTLLYIDYKISGSRYRFYRYLFRNEDSFPLSFDLAVAFAGPYSLIDFFVCEKVIARKKCGWVHFDVSKFGVDKGMINRLYPIYNKIFIVSETGKEIFDKRFPRLSQQTEVFHNIVSQDQIEELAETGPTFTDYFDGKRILTVGRLSKEKGQHVAIEALKLLLDKGYNVQWYFVGDGINRNNCEQLARQYGIENRVIFLGTQTNPYRFMKDCDIYVQPSRYEGFCITLAEALCFSHPIVATEFTGAKEQLQYRDNCIVTGMKADDIAAGLEEVLSKGIMQCPVNNSSTYDIKPFLDLVS